VENNGVGSEKLFLIGRLASPHWYRRNRDRIENIQPEWGPVGCVTNVEMLWLDSLTNLVLN